MSLSKWVRRVGKPVAFAASLIPFVMLAFLTTERLGAELKNPFEELANDTPMTALCRTIEIDLRQQLGEKEVPLPLGPVNGVVM